MRKTGKLLLLVVIVLLGGLQISKGQIKKTGIPEIRYYDRHAYDGGTQNWSIVQDDNGLMYFGNNKGLVSFDGSHWNLYPMPNHAVTRAIAKGENGRIYMGGYDIIGFLYIDDDGKRKFRDLTQKLPSKSRDFGEIWRIHVTDNGVIFQSYSTVILYHDGEVKVLSDESDYQYSFYLDDVFYISHRKKGLLKYTGQSFVPVKGGDFFTEDRKIWAMLPFEGISYLMGTQEKGLYIYEEGRITPWESPANEFLKKNQLFSARKLSSQHYAFGSIQDGLIICDDEGHIIQHINKNRGLANNTVLGLQMDDWGNLWCGLDNGINYIEIHSPITYLDEGRNIEGTGYTSAMLEDKIYLGTNQGVYVNSWNNKDPDDHKSNRFKLINSLKGQTWMLQTIDDRVFCGHNKGTYIIKDDNIRLLSGVEGGWRYLRVPGNDSLIIAGTYSGLIRIVKQSGDWVYDGRVKGFNESCRDIFFDKYGDLWMGHGYLGIFRLNLNKELDSVVNITAMGTEQNVYTQTEFYIFELGDEVFHSSYDSVFKYNFLANRFEYAPEWTEKFGGKGVNRLHRDKYRNIWYFERYDNRVNLVHGSNSAWNNKSFDILNKLNDRFINAFEHVHVIDEQNILFGIEKGFAHLNPLLIKKEKKVFSTIITSVKAFTKRDTVVKHFNKSSSEKPYPVFNFYPATNTIRFNYSAAFYEGYKNMQYSLRLKGPDEVIRAGWTHSNTKEFTHLSHGKHQLTLKAKNVYGKESEPITLSFIIETPWYKTTWAYVLYVAVSLLAVYAAFRFINKRIENERQKMEKKKKEEVKEKEEQRKQDAIVFENKIIQLKNDKLKAEVARKKTDVELKNKELASFAVQINHKNEILNHMKSELDKVCNRLNDQARGQLRELSKKIDDDIKLDEDWQQFKIHFDRVQQDFLKKMQSRYPELKPNDLKLCAFLRMNLSTKEIAPLMNISIRGVEIQRYRLRKKLDLARETNLVEFLMQI